MAGVSDSEYRREMLARLLPYMALSAIRVGIFTSPLGLLASAVEEYNQGADKTKKKVDDILSLVSWAEKLQFKVEGAGTVSLMIQREDLRSCAVQYLARTFRLEGVPGAPDDQLTGRRLEAEFDHVMRLPSRNVYMKLLDTLTIDGASRFLELARSLNPSEVWIFADRGEEIDVALDPVFLAENVALRGRLKSMMTAQMLSELFDEKFGVSVEPKSDDSVRVVLRLRN